MLSRTRAWRVTEDMSRPSCCSLMSSPTATID
jgi:hypothetical protein